MHTIRSRWGTGNEYTVVLIPPQGRWINDAPTERSGRPTRLEPSSANSGLLLLLVSKRRLLRLCESFGIFHLGYTGWKVRCGSGH